MAAAAVNFVTIVQQYPCLYNNKLWEYSRKDITDKAWSEVAEKTNTSVADCQTKWRNIRNGFVRSMKPTANGTKQKKLYYLHYELQFLLPFVRANIHTNDTGNTADPPEENTDESSSEETPINHTDTLETQSFGDDESNSYKIPKKRKFTNEDKAYMDWIKTDSPRKMFLLSLLPDIENFSEEQMRKFRIKMLLLLEEIQSDQSRPPQLPHDYQNQQRFSGFEDCQTHEIKQEIDM